MEQKVRHIESIAEYQAMLGVETLHPLVGVIDFSEVQPIYHLPSDVRLLCDLRQRRSNAAI